MNIFKIEKQDRSHLYNAGHIIGYRDEWVITWKSNAPSNAIFSLDTERKIRVQNVVEHGVSYGFFKLETWIDDMDTPVLQEALRIAKNLMRGIEVAPLMPLPADWVAKVESSLSSEIGRLDRLAKLRQEITPEMVLRPQLRDLAHAGLEDEIKRIKQQIGDQIWSLHLIAEDQRSANKRG